MHAQEGTAGGPVTDGPTGGAEGAQPPKSKAGRNLPAAIGVGAGLGALVIGTLIFLPPRMDRRRCDRDVHRDVGGHHAAS